MKKYNAQTNRKERGNALFLILIAVALFAALSYAITQSGRGSGTVDRETSMINAGGVAQYPAGLRTAVTRMIITGTPASGSTGVAVVTTTTGKTYELFDQAGGAAAIVAPAPAAVDATLTGWTFVDATAAANGYYVKDVGTNTSISGREVLAVLGNGATPATGAGAANKGVTLGVCQQILKGLGIATFTTPTAAAVAMDWGNGGAATYNVAAANTLNSAAAGINGNPFLCYQNSTGVYHYYHALIEQ